MNMNREMKQCGQIWEIDKMFRVKNLNVHNKCQVMHRTEEFTTKLLYVPPNVQCKPIENELNWYTEVKSRASVDLFWFPALGGITWGSFISFRFILRDFNYSNNSWCRSNRFADLFFHIANCEPIWLAHSC